MTKRRLMIIIFSIFLLGLGGCAANDVKTGQAPVNPILVGVTRIIHLSSSKERADYRVGSRSRPTACCGTGRPIEFVEISWERQIPALLEGKIDIIMSGMTITQARQVRINFSQPYLTSGLMIAFAAENASQYTSLQNIMESIPVVGFVAGTTGEVYARDKFREGNRMIPVKSANEAALALKTRE